MIGTSTYDYVFIRACIVGLHTIAPLSILYCLVLILYYGFRPAICHRIPLPLEIWAIAEAAFYVLVHVWYRKQLQSEAIHPPARSRQERKELVERCNANVPDPEEYLQKWFLGARAEDIKRDNVKEFMLWAFFNRGGPPGEDDEELEEYVAVTENLLGREIEGGRGSAQCLRLTLDQVNMLHRSIIWYFCVGFVDFLTYIRLLYFGFHFHRATLSRFFTLFPLRPITLFSSYRSPVKHLTYWHRPHTSRGKLPIVFIHGIGIGLYPYVDFLAELNSADGVEGPSVDDEVGIIAIEIMPVSFRLTHATLTKDEICAEIQRIVNYHGYDKFVLVAHSYGTAISTHLLKSPQMAQQIGPVLLIDPISVLLHLPDVAFNFTWRKPSGANEHQLFYFASMDPGVSHALARGFFWSEMILWKEDIGDRRFTVSLAEKDLIVNTEAVGRYLASPSPQIKDNKTCHGNRRASRSRGEAKSRIQGHSGELVLANGYGHSNGHIDKHTNGDLNGHAHCQLSGAKERYDDADDDDDDKWKSRPWDGQGVDVIWHERLDHAQVFDKARTRKKLINVIKVYCSQPASI